MELMGFGYSTVHFGTHCASMYQQQRQKPSGSDVVVLSSHNTSASALANYPTFSTLEDSTPDSPLAFQTSLMDRPRLC
jgi:hypothetical protein